MTTDFYKNVIRNELAIWHKYFEDAIKTIDALAYLDTLPEKPYSYSAFHSKLVLVDRLYKLALANRWALKKDEDNGFDH